MSAIRPGYRKRSFAALLSLFVLTACGRLGFEQLPDPGNVPGKGGGGGTLTGGTLTGGTLTGGTLTGGAMTGGFAPTGGAMTGGFAPTGGAFDDGGLPDAGCTGDLCIPPADNCPDDSEKLEAGVCGCGVVEDDLDTDNDGKPDCIDLCSGIDDASYVANNVCGLGYCSTDTTPSTCVDGVETACKPGPQLTADDATCDAVDDNCDGNFDEDYVGAATNCGQGACVAQGSFVCVGGSPVDNCTAGAAGLDTNCDGIDDDCNGVADDGYVQTVTSCGVGVCAAGGMLTCMNGAEIDTCAIGTGAADDANCDGIDDDCSGQADEDYIATATNCGSGACTTTGLNECQNGALVDTCAAGSGAADDATCDGVDDDCDGSIDEDYAPLVTSCGTGACNAAGVTSCSGGSVSDSCSAGAPAPSDATCDGIDNNCNGSTDEGYAPVVTSCGVGACGAAGVTSCSGGSVSDSCSPGAPAPSDATCDGVDNNCNGSTDEGYAPVVTSCGVGACGAAGVTSCSGGSVSDSCSAGAPTSDNNCDGIDNNCNGSTDEDYAPVVTSCGVGACGAAGVTSCSGGSVSDSCSPGAPAPSDATCDGVDNNCNGSTDEGYLAPGTVCGVGACAAVGADECVSGNVIDSCSTGSPSSDANCDGIDNNCNGSADEDYVADATCGVGYCLANNTQSSCAAGGAETACAPGAQFSSDDATADGVDDDCDGAVDEDACTAPPEQYATGSHTLTAPAGCSLMTVELWGAGGGAGGGDTIGAGAPGGYARTDNLAVAGTLNLYVGSGGNGCGNGGIVTGISTYNGGAGGSDGFTSTAGSAGEDQIVAGGGTGSTGNSGKDGGDGYYGGGGGGGGGNAPWPPYASSGGGGGAASAFVMAGTVAVAAGGGGGGGGRNGTGAVPSGASAAGGSGCGANGGTSGSGSGGGGGGGTCVGTIQQLGTGNLPFGNGGSDLPAGRAVGATSGCGNGGDGYAIVTWGS